MTDVAVFADGPLRGEARDIEPWIRDGGLMWRVAPEFTIASASAPPYMPDFETVHYRFSRILAFGRVITVGSVAEPPSDDDLFAALISGAAQKAAVAIPVTA